MSQKLHFQRHQKENPKMPKGFKEQRAGNRGLITKWKAGKKEAESI